MDAWLLAQYANIEAIKTEVLGMVALNQYRTHRGEVIAYDEAAFKEKAETLHNISSQIMRSMIKEG